VDNTERLAEFPESGDAIYTDRPPVRKSLHSQLPDKGKEKKDSIKKI